MQMVKTAHKLIGKDFVFQEDNDPKHGGEHGCKIVEECIADK